jgi:hypothetical protein
MDDKTNQFITPLLTKFLSGYFVFILIGFVVSTIIAGRIQLKKILSNQ